jgi:Zn ribbon nucleic-acid-binding protein
MPLPEQQGCGTGHLRSGQRDLGLANYEIHVGMPNRPGTTVELESPPVAQNGEILELTLEDGGVLQIQALGESPYCRVVGERTAHERRGTATVPVASTMDQRRRSDARSFLAISHPCPRCMANEVLVTHRGVMMVTLHCTACGHGWGEAPSTVAAATRMDRRAIERPEPSDRRAADRVPPPVCAYCSTDAHVRSIRRTADEVYFACDGCESMWALPRPRHGQGHPRPLESR